MRTGSFWEIDHSILQHIFVMIEVDSLSKTFYGAKRKPQMKSKSESTTLHPTFFDEFRLNGIVYTWMTTYPIMRLL